jgi:hypothetical protein
MTVYTKEQALRDLESVLTDASVHGEVRIRREDGSEFALRPVGRSVGSGAEQKLCDEPQRDLSDIAGTWVEDPEFDEVMKAQRQIDPELWK